ncbi:MAG: hypothetical protein GVY26_22245 [Bacteroidetes bacterium]|jgi:hypothetical protein|nr:hypothetical protein [Bacteroidota bacterium]
MKPRKIHSISALRQRRKELEIEMQVTRQAIGHSVKKTEYEARGFLVKNILIPIGAGGLAAILFNKDNIKYETDERPAWLVFLQQMMDVINERFSPSASAEEAPEPQQPPTEQG